MDVAAFIVSVVALAVSIASVAYSRRQTEASEITAKLDSDRRLEERTPEFEGVVEKVGGNESYRLSLRLTKGGPLVAITVTIVGGDGVQFSGNQHGVPGPEPRASAETVEPVRPGFAATWHVLLSDERSRTVRLVAHCRGEQGEEWKVPVQVDLPHEYDVLKSVW